MIRTEDMKKGIIIEIKYTEANMEEVCQKALRQIEEKNYAEELRREGVHTILKYGIACNRKNCRVRLRSE